MVAGGILVTGSIRGTPVNNAAMLAIGAGLGLLTRPFSSDLLAGLFGSDFAPASSFLDSVLLVLPIWFASIAINSTLVSHRLADLRLGTQVIAVGILIVTPLVMSSALRMICGVMKTNNVDMVVCWVRFLNR